MSPSTPENAFSGPHDGNAEDGTAPALSNEPAHQGPGPVGFFKLGSQVFARRDRWGKIARIATCEVCGRRLFVNWTRARPCLFCDDSAKDAKRGAER